MNDFGMYVGILLVSVLISSVSQIILKNSADRTYKNALAEYLNVRVITAYGLFFLSTVLTMIALKRVPLSMSPILESTGYIYISVMGYFFLKEKFTKRKAAGMALILVGIAIYSLKL